MIVNAIFSCVKIYDVGSRLDVVIGQEFSIEITDGEPEDLEIFANNDPVLGLDADGKHGSALSLGESKIRFMSGTAVIKDIDINVVNATSPNATTLGGSLGKPEPK